MNVGPILALAEYFTGPRVAAHSIALQVPGKMRDEAQAFFKARAALGISGYPDRPEAVRQITRALEVDDDLHRRLVDALAEIVRLRLRLGDNPHTPLPGR